MDGLTDKHPKFSVILKGQVPCFLLTYQILVKVQVQKNRNFTREMITWAHGESSTVPYMSLVQSTIVGPSRTEIKTVACEVVIGDAVFCTIFRTLYIIIMHVSCSAQLLSGDVGKLSQKHTRIVDSKTVQKVRRATVGR